MPKREKMMSVDLFKEFGELIGNLHPGCDVEEFTSCSSSGHQLVSSFLNGRVLSESVFVVCVDQDSQLGSLLFGSIRPTYDRTAEEISASDRGRTLRVRLFSSTEILQESLTSTPNAVVLQTDFRSFTFRQTDDTGLVSEPFAVFNLLEMCEEIAFNGSVWATIYPSHFAIVTRTISFSFPTNTVGPLFSGEFSADDDISSKERSAYKGLCCFDSHSTQLLSLDELRLKMNSRPRPPKLLSERTEGSFTIRKYSPQRSSIFDFGDPACDLSRGDFVTTYNAGSEEFHREFFVSPRNWEPHEEELRLAAFDILHLLAIRRTKLFRVGFASRVYNILLPPLLLIDESISGNSYALFPCLNLYRTPQAGFRRTLSMTFITCPVEIIVDQGTHKGIVSRSAPIEELHKLKDDLSFAVDPAVLQNCKGYTISESKRQYYTGLSVKCSIPETLRHISEKVLHRILTRGYGADTVDQRVASDSLFTSNLESKIATILLQTEWMPPEGFAQPWERWITTGEDKVFRNSLYRTLFYKDYLQPYSSDAPSRYAVQFAEFNVGNTLGADMAGMTLYNPQDHLKVVLYPRIFEEYPNRSILRWMAWQVYIDSALSSMRALIYKFHPLLENRGDLHSIIYAIDEMIKEFVDFYDLDIRDHFYRKEYEKLRRLMQVDTDYAQLLTKYSSSKEDESLREQRLINKLIVSLTIATVTVTVVSTIAGMGELSVSSYLLIALVLSTVMVWIGYILFDPIRSATKRLFNEFRKMREED